MEFSFFLSVVRVLFVALLWSCLPAVQVTHTVWAAGGGGRPTFGPAAIWSHIPPPRTCPAVWWAQAPRRFVTRLRSLHVLRRLQCTTGQWRQYLNNCPPSNDIPQTSTADKTRIGKMFKVEKYLGSSTMVSCDCHTLGRKIVGNRENRTAVVFYK